MFQYVLKLFSTLIHTDQMFIKQWLLQKWQKSIKSVLLSFFYRAALRRVQGVHLYPFILEEDLNSTPQFLEFPINHSYFAKIRRFALLDLNLQRWPLFYHHISANF